MGLTLFVSRKLLLERLQLTKRPAPGIIMSKSVVSNHIPSTTTSFLTQIARAARRCQLTHLWPQGQRATIPHSEWGS